MKNFLFAAAACLLGASAVRGEIAAAQAKDLPGENAAAIQELNKKFDQALEEIRLLNEKVRCLEQRDEIRLLNEKAGRGERREAGQADGGQRTQLLYYNPRRHVSASCHCLVQTGGQHAFLPSGVSKRGEITGFGDSEAAAIADADARCKEISAKYFVRAWECNT